VTCPEDYVAPEPASLRAAPLSDERILFSRLYGGSTGPTAAYFAPDIGRSILYKDGHLFVTGHTFAADFPVIHTPAHPFTSTHNGDWDALVIKLDGDGNPLFSRYLGQDLAPEHKAFGLDIAVDEEGNIYVTGSMYAATLSPDGNQVDTQGAASHQRNYGIAVDSDNQTYVAGGDIAVEEGGSRYIAGATGVTKLDPEGTTLWTTNLDARAQAIALGHELVYAAGYTLSDGLPVTPGAFDTSSDPQGDAFVAVLDSDGNVLYATYLGGEDNHDQATGIAVDEVGYVYVGGFTYSAGFPATADAVYPIKYGYGDAFLAVIYPAGSGAADLVHATFLGGNDPAMPPHAMPDRAYGLALDGEAGHVYLVGEAGSDDFPTTDGSTLAGFTDVFVTKLDLFDDVQAGFSATPLGGFAPLQVSFSDESTGDVAFHWWDFGDGEHSDEADPVHTFTEPGTYSVTLTASGPGGRDTEEKVAYVTVWDKHRVYLPLVVRGWSP
jgi:hypothetical protein